MPNEPSYRLGRRPALDGLRGLAVAMVVLSHACVPLMVGAGTVGVTLFFVLSGFLITRLLLEEHGRTGRISLQAFYMRRARRLAPALVLFLAVSSATLASHGITPGEVVSAVTYTANLSRWTGVEPRFLAHTWSLSLEEQFYLAWPFVLVFLLRRRRHLIGWALAAVGVAVVVNRLWLSANSGDVHRVFGSPDVRSDALVAGCILAVYIGRVASMRLRFSAIAAGVLVVLCFPSYEPALMILLAPITASCGVLVAWGATTGSASWLTSRPLVGLGRISYGVYLWHYPVTMLLVYAQVPWWVVTGIAVPTSVLLAWMSWRFVEAPVMARGRRTESASVPDSALATT